jgi:choline dehydrogenase-like flavoprotein
VFCNREVILAAGAIFSPALLQVSGIGPADVLNELNVSVKVDLPGVGQNFQDHPMVGVFYNCELSLINAPTLLSTHSQTRHQTRPLLHRQPHRRHPPPRQRILLYQPNRQGPPPSPYNPPLTTPP